MNNITPNAIMMDEAPKRARPAFVGWLAGGKQEFPNDPALDLWRHAQLKAAGMIKVRRIPAVAMAAA